MTSAWITGAHGFIGRYLARELKEKRYQVAGIGHGAWPEAEATRCGLTFWLNGEVSSSNLEQMRHSLGLPDVIFHLAGGSSVGMAIVNPYEDFTRTVFSTAGLLEWLRQHSPATRLVAISSAAVYGAGHNGLIPERTPLSPFSPYGAHKLMMEQLCRSYATNFSLPIILPRLFSVFGVGLKKQLLWDMCSKIASGGKIELDGSGNEVRDWIDVRDAARALEQIEKLATPASPAINLASGKGTSVREIADMINSHWGDKKSSVGKIEFSGQSRPGDPFSMVADVSQMQTHGIKNLIPLSQGVGEYVDWYRSQMNIF